MTSAPSPPEQTPALLPTDQQLDELRKTTATDLAAAAKRTGGAVDERKEKRAISRIDRGDKMEGHLHTLLVIGLWMAGTAILGVFLSVLWNMAVPHQYRYLEAAEVDTLKSFLFSGAIGSAITAAGRKVAGGKAASDEDAE
jgi:hypothetical protein